MTTFSRRTFLKASSASLAGLLLPAGLAEASHQRVRGLYFPTERLTDAEAVAAFQDVVLQSRANAVVLDVKNEGGIVHVAFDHPLKPGRKPRYAYPDLLAEFVRWCRDHRVRPVARQVVFQDGWLASAHPAQALLDFEGRIWRDADGQGRAFTDPFSEDVHDYNATIAQAAIAAGFPEVQFDYIRFPTGHVRSIAFRRAWTFENRTAAIAQFLETASARVRAAGGLVSADVFGIASWAEQKDAGIGQYLEALAPHLDALCPMAYPSTYGTGIPDCDDRCKPATAYPREIVYHTTRLALERVQPLAPQLKVIPWIQVFDDYRFSRPFDLPEYWAQQQGAREAGAGGVYAWAPAGDYPVELFRPR